MSNIVIRRMLISDLEQVAVIENENFSMPWSEKSFAESLQREDTLFLVAAEKEEILGYVGCYCIAGSSEITNVAVKHSHRRRGIGSMLLEELFVQGASFNTLEYILEVRESNKAAIALYRRKGFEEEGIRKNFYEKPLENAVIMCKR